MKKRNNEENTDMEECRNKIQALLREYNCELLDPDEGHHVLIWDKDTNKIDNIYT